MINKLLSICLAVDMFILSGLNMTFAEETISSTTGGNAVKFISFPGWASGTINKVRVDRSGKGIVYFNSNITYKNGSRPACVNRDNKYNNALAFDTNKEGGRSILKLVLAAKLSKTPVQARGTATCTIYGDNVMEDWSYGYIN